MSVVEAMSYDRLQFNALPAVDVADENVRANDKLNIALAVLRPIFVQHGFCDAWGISLLHKHWLLEEGELPVQEIVCKDEETVFITRPRASDFAGRFLPSIMKVSSDMRLRVVEFSNDPNVHMAHDLLRAAPQFVTAFCRTVVANHLADTFGLIANKATMEGRGLIEFNYTDRMSVLGRVFPRTIQEGRLSKQRGVLLKMRPGSIVISTAPLVAIGKTAATEAGTKNIIP